MNVKPLVLCIMDGYGLERPGPGNAIEMAARPNLKSLFASFPHTRLEASGLAVGLPQGQMGNSEVGHLNIGAGRVVYQALTLVDAQIASGQFFTNPVLLGAIDHVKARSSRLHLFGLLSDGGVHSHINHVKALVRLARDSGLEQVYVHAFLDGRDVPPTSAPSYIQQLQDYFEELGFGQIVTISGRYYAMDRDKNFDRLDKYYRCLTAGEGATFTDPLAYVASCHRAGVDDEFIEPACRQGYVPLASGDAVIYANFRPDRAIQLSTVLTNPGFYPNYHPSPVLSDVHLVQMFKYADSVKGPVAFAVPPLDNILGRVLADNGLSQLRIAETEKYAHVTFFFDGGVNYDGVSRDKFKGSDRILVDSPKVATYDLQPRMSIDEVTAKVCAAVASGRYDVIILNFANCDMVGHTAVLDSVVEAVGAVDQCVGLVYQAVREAGGVLIVTADHGNADKVIDEEGRPFTAHTTAQVPFLVTLAGVALRDGGVLADIAPTMLELLGVPAPVEMTGKSLIQARAFEDKRQEGGK